MNQLKLPRKSESKPEIDLETLVFMQLTDWLESKGPCLQNYEQHLSVAPRRGQLQSKVWRRKLDGQLVVLKTFNRLNLKTIQRAILNEIVVPYVTKSPRVLRPSNFFLENEVRFSVHLVECDLLFDFFVENRQN